MTSIDALIARAKRLHGVNDDVLEEEWNNICSLAYDNLIRDLEE